MGYEVGIMRIIGIDNDWHLRWIKQIEKKKIYLFPYFTESQSSVIYLKSKYILVCKHISSFLY